MLRAGRRNINYVQKSSGFNVNEEIEWFQMLWNPSARGGRYQPLFNLLEPILLSQLSFSIYPRTGICAIWCWRIQAPRMQPQSKLMALEYQMPYRLLLRELDWEFDIGILS